MAVKLLDMYVDINADGKKAAREASDDFRSVGEPGFARNGLNFGKRMVGGLALAVGGAAIAGVGTLAGVALTKGLDRALSIQDATAKLAGLGHSGESVRQIMDNALASVKGTAFGLGDAASVAAGAVAAGIAPGEKLTRVLKLTADAATIAGTTMGDMGSIFNKVAASGKLQGDVIAQLQDAGVPVLQFVAKQMGVTAEEAANLASQGKVSFETFSDAMEAGLGGAALSSGATARGAFANVGAALGRLGAMFTTPLVAAAPAFFSTLGKAIDSLAVKAQPFADKFSAWVGPAIENAGNKIAEFINGEPGKLADFFDGVSSVLGTLAPLFPDLLRGLAEFGSTVAGIVGPAIVANLPALQSLASQLAELAVTVLPQVLPVLADLVLAVLPLIPALLPLVEQILPPLIDLIGALVQPTDELNGASSGVTTAISALVSALIFLIQLLPGPIPLLTQVIGVFNGTISVSNFMADVFEGRLGPVIRNLAVVVFAVVSAFQTAMSSLRSAVEAGVNAVVSAFQRAFNALPQPVRNAMSILASVISSGVNTAVSIVSSLGSRAAGAIGNLGGALLGAGRSLVDGFVQGITSGIQRAASAAAQVAQAAVNAAKAALDINSPSRVFRDQVGKQVGAGFIVGLEAMAPKMQVAMATAVTPGASISRVVDRGYATAPSLREQGAVAQPPVPAVTNNYVTVPVTAADNPTLYGDRTARAIVAGLI